MNEFWCKKPNLAVIAAAIAFALGTSAQEPTRENANRPQTGAQQQETQIARSDAGLQTLEQYLQGKTLRVSKIVGMELQTRSGDNLGEVKDVLRAAAPGQDMQLVVQIGGIGADEKLIAVPFDEAQINANGDELYTNRTRDQLAAAPAIQLGQRTTATATPAERNTAEANRDAANRGGAAPQPGAEPRATQPAAPSVGQRSTGATASVSQNRLADLVGAEIVGSGGDKVAEIDDIVISTAGADSVRAVMQVGGVAGVGEKRVALPLGQITVDRAGNDSEPTLRVAMDREALERLPEFKYEERTSAL